MEEKLCESCPLYGVEEKCKLTRDTVDCKIAKALRNCSYSKGIVCLEEEEHELGCEGEYYDGYLAIGTLAKLLKDGKAMLTFSIGREDKDMNYLLNALGRIK